MSIMIRRITGESLHHFRTESELLELKLVVTVTVAYTDGSK